MALRLQLYVLCLVGKINGLFWIGSSISYGTLNEPFTLTCNISNLIFLWKETTSSLSIQPAVVSGTYNNGSCKFDSGPLPDYTFTCDPTEGVYTMTIPGTLMTNTFHNTKWICEDLFGGDRSNTFVLKINVPVTNLTLTPPINTGEIKINETETTTFTCRTNKIRPNATIEWYLGITNVTNDGVPTTDSAENDMVVSSSKLQYTGNRGDHMKTLYCTAQNLQNTSPAQSAVKTLNIQYGPEIVTISPTNTSYLLEEGEDVKITCTADCRPNCRIVWKGPNMAITESDSLDIQTIDRNQEGDYYCEASNLIRTKTSVSIAIDVKYGPKTIVISPANTLYTVNELGNINQISCLADCDPACTKIWIGPNLPQGTTSILNLQNIDRNQAGMYHCTAKNNIGNQTSVTVQVVVNYGPGTVALLPSTTEYAVTEFGNINQISCSAECNPTCTMTWTGPNLPQGTTSILILQNIDRNQAGSYHCTARNNIESRTSVPVHVLVNYGPRSVHISPSNLSYTVTEGGGLNIVRCTADCKPDCSFTWTGPSLHDHVNSTLHLQNINRNQTGSYQCTARNNIGNIVSDAVNVLVNYGPLDVSLSSTQRHYNVNESKGHVGPINCTADCQPECNIHWTGPVYDMQNTFLYLTHIKRNGTGNYSCTASNTINNRTSESIRVTVNYKPNVADLLGNGTVNENDTVVMRCHVYSFPLLSISWTLDNSTIQQDSNVLIENATNFDVHNSKLIIYKVACLMMGKYSCRATNILGSDGISENLNVKCYPRVEKELPTKKPIRDNEAINITTPVIGYPPPTFFWTFRKNGTAKNFTGGISNDIGVNMHVSNLLIDKPTDDDFGFYEIYANSNVNGTRLLHTYHVIPERKPDPPKNIACDAKLNSVTVVWQSGFHGGRVQNFTVLFKIVHQKEWVVCKDFYKDPGQGMNQSAVIQPLRPATKYIFQVYAQNIHGVTNSSNNVFCNTTEEVNEHADGNSLALVGSAVGIAAAVVIFSFIGIAVFILRKRRNVPKDKEKKLISSPENYTEFTTYSNTVTDTYDVINQTTDIDKSRNPSVENERSANTYENCQPNNSPDNDYYNVKPNPKGSKLTKAADYENLKF